MNLLSKVKRRLEDMKTLKDTGLRADEIAKGMGEELVGAEHWLLAALELPDGTARLAFQQLGADPEQLKDAIAQQYADALNEIGINTSELDIPDQTAGANNSNGFTFQAQASSNALFAEMTDKDRLDNNAPFIGATIVQGAACLEKGTVPRSLEAMGVDRNALSLAAEKIIAERRR